MLGIGIVGLPNVGKSTLFNAITRAGALAANYPFATIDKNVGMVAVPDERLVALRDVFTKGERVPPVIPTTVEFVDIAGLVKGASRGEGLGNQFLANIREVSAVAHVVRCFDDPGVIHVAGEIDPLSDVETIDTELALADIASLEKRLEKLRRSARVDKEDALVVEAAERLMARLSEGVPARLTGIDLPKDFNLLTAKPVVYVCNVPETDVVSGNAHSQKVRALAESEGAEVVLISARIEQELGELSEEEAGEFLQDFGLTEPGLNRLIRVGYKALGLITFITAGEKEVRAWTVAEGSKAPRAAGVIHSDFERGFIRAEVIRWDKLVEAGGLVAAKGKGWVRTEGKDYVMQDGDVMNVLFNV
ncbi:MAG: redox-regulated ATPase YchF [Deinococcota bacterium]|nr:redox-regulated ATPase YchF [Deinococcota bacterium]